MSIRALNSCASFSAGGKPEYNCGLVPDYLRDIDQHFATARQHPVVKLTREVAATVGFDAPMHLAVHLTDANRPPCAGRSNPGRRGSTDVGGRPSSGNSGEGARQFVREANFDEFCQAHRELYDETPNARADY
jgi:hypothetical protein